MGTRPSTFSIVALDASSGDLGVAVASKFLAVGAVVPWARAGVGAVATQARANTTFGPEGLRLMDAGCTARQTLDELLLRDGDREERQVGIVDARGGSESFTGTNCNEWAGGVSGPGYAIQGNILAGPDVVEAMQTTFVAGNDPLSQRLLAALAAADAAGGDRRGKQSAALLVVHAQGGYGGLNDRYVDLRVDDAADPIGELTRLLNIHSLFFDRPRLADSLAIEGALAKRLHAILQITGDLEREPSEPYDAAVRDALRALVERENLEERWYDDAQIDRVAWEYLQSRYLSHGAS